MEIINDTRQLYRGESGLILHFLSRKRTYIFLNSNYLLRREIYVGIEWGAPSAIWKPLGFNRCVLYG